MAEGLLGGILSFNVAGLSSQTVHRVITTGAGSVTDQEISRDPLNTGYIKQFAPVGSNPVRLDLLGADAKLRMGTGPTDVIVLSGGTVTITGNIVSSTLAATTLTMNVGSIVTDTTTGLKIGTGATQKLGFWNATPVVQPATHGLDVTGFVAGSGTASKADSSWAGPTGSTAYGVGDIVGALKSVGFLAA